VTYAGRGWAEINVNLKKVYKLWTTLHLICICAWQWNMFHLVLYKSTSVSSLLRHPCHNKISISNRDIYHLDPSPCIRQFYMQPSRAGDLAKYKGDVKS
jgi:hypothetical protein